MRATVSDMGPLLLGRMLDLNDTQAGVLNLVFKIADDNGLLLLDLKDLRAMLQHVGDNASEFTTEYGNVSAASVGAIQRGLLQVEARAATSSSASRCSTSATSCRPSMARAWSTSWPPTSSMKSPRLYATFLLWMLSELFEQLPEVGDPEKPKLVFFFDEAHLLFNDAPKVLVERIELVVRLVRSKGVGVYFVTQNPLDIPDSVLAQLGNRVQHALRAFTPRDQKAVKATAQTMRQKPGLDIETAITELAVGEALVSLLDAKGRPGITERAFVLPPGSQIGPITPAAAPGPAPGLAGRGCLRKSRGPRIGLRRHQGPRRGGSQPKPPRRPSGGAAGAERLRRHPGRAQRRPVRHHRPARRQARRPGAEHGQVRRAHHGLGRGPRDHPRGAGQHLRRQEAAGERQSTSTRRLLYYIAACSAVSARRRQRRRLRLVDAASQVVVGAVARAEIATYPVLAQDLRARLRDGRSASNPGACRCRSAAEPQA